MGTDPPALAAQLERRWSSGQGLLFVVMWSPWRRQYTAFATFLDAGCVVDAPSVEALEARMRTLVPVEAQAPPAGPPAAHTAGGVQDGAGEQSKDGD